MAGKRGFEPPTYSLGGCCHIQVRPLAHEWKSFFESRRNRTKQEIYSCFISFSLKKLFTFSTTFEINVVYVS